MAARTSGGLLVVGISEHVTYWNQLGWSDPYSSPAYTDRQNAYGQRFQLDGVYTPQMVINGAEQIVGQRLALRWCRRCKRRKSSNPGCLSAFCR